MRTLLTGMRNPLTNKREWTDTELVLGFLALIGLGLGYIQCLIWFGSPFLIATIVAAGILVVALRIRA